MTTFSHTIAASGGDYTTYTLWQTARIASGDAGSGDTEEAVFLDGDYTATGTLSTSWPAGVTVLVKAQNPHLNDWSISSQGAKTIAPTTGPCWSLSGSYNNDITWVFEDLVVMGNPTTGFRPGFNGGTTGGTGLDVIFRRCLVDSGTVTNNTGLRGDDTASLVTLTVDNCVVLDTTSAGSGAIFMRFTAGGKWTVNIISSVVGKSTSNSSGSATMNWVVDGSILMNNPGSATSRTATDSFSETNWTGWSTTNCGVATIVTGTPSSGQIGVTDRSGRDFSLVDHADNVAIDYVTNATVPTYDILGNTRDATPDCGAFEIVAAGTTVTPGAASLALTAFAPTVTVTEHVTVVPGFGELTLTAHAPTVTVTDHQVVEPGAAALTLTTYAPVVTAGDNKIVEPGAASLTLTPYAPTVVTTGDLTVVPGYGELMLVAFAPTIFVGDDIAVEPGAATLTLIAYPPAIATEPVAVVTLASWSTRDIIEAGDEWRLVLTGPSADAPRVRILLRFQKP